MTAAARLPTAPSRVFEALADLGTYPHWLGIVQAAEVVADGAWAVELGARLGPLRRTKRVRMVRTVCEADERVRFDRAELDGREHSPWVLEAEVVPDGEGSALTMHLHYGGGAWLPGLDLVLRQEVRCAAARLTAVLGG